MTTRIKESLWYYKRTGNLEVLIDDEGLACYRKDSSTLLIRVACEIAISEIAYAEIACISK